MVRGFLTVKARVFKPIDDKNNFKLFDALNAVNASIYIG